MIIPFLDLKIQYNSLKSEILPAIEEVLSNTAFVLGKAVSEFEQKFAEAHNAKYCYGVGTGTAGNHLVLWALGIGPGDEVIIPANTFIATAWGATLCGAQPVFVDCHSESYNLDPTKLHTGITPKTRAIVAVHLYGQPADIDGIEKALVSANFEKIEAGTFIHKKTNQKIYVVEDCAQAHLSEYKGKKIGTLGIASSWSFYPGKNLGACGEGGAVMTNDPELAKKFKMIRDHGAEKKYFHEILGHNYRMEGIQGAVLGIKLKYLAQWTELRRAVAQKYNVRLQGTGDVFLPKELPYAKHVYHLYVIQTTKRNELQSYLNSKGIGTGLHYPVPLHLQKCFLNYDYSEGDFPITEQLAKKCLSLPMFAEMTDEQIEYVVNVIKEFYI